MGVKVKGTVAEVFMALDERGMPHLENTARHIEYLLENGVEGFFVSGVAAEGFTFSLDEKISWLETVVDVANGKVPVIFNISSINLNEVKLLAKQAEDVGADIISVTQPSPISFSDVEIEKYFEELASYINKPIMLYNEPAIGNPLKADLLKKIFHSHKNIEFYKDSTHNMIELHSLFSANIPQKVFAGSDALIYDIMGAGGIGVVSLIADVFPKLVTDLVLSMENKNYSKALEQQRFILKVRSLLKAPGLTAGYRYASSLVGIELGSPRKPYSPISEKDKEMLKKGLMDLGLI